MKIQFQTNLTKIWSWPHITVTALSIDLGLGLPWVWGLPLSRLVVLDFKVPEILLSKFKTVYSYYTKSLLQQPLSEVGFLDETFLLHFCSVVLDFQVPEKYKFQ